jgi:cytochrome c biogenesis protein CcdA
VPEFSDNPSVFRLVGLVVSIGIADSLNPSTIVPALYLASGEHARADVLRFTVGVFVIYLAGGIAIALGPGELILDALPHPPHHDARHVIEIIVGAIVVAVAWWIWSHRERLSARAAPDAPGPKGSSSILLGMTITAIELPTAFPYFAVITAIVSDNLTPVHTIALLVLFNVIFILPLLAILATLWFAGAGAIEILTRCRAWLHRHWPVLLSVAALTAGVISILVGVTGLIVGYSGDVPNFVRHVRHLFHLSTKP